MGPEAGGPPRRRWIQAGTNVVEAVNGQIELMRRKLPTLKLKLPWLVSPLESARGRRLASRSRTPSINSTLSSSYGLEREE